MRRLLARIAVSAARHLTLIGTAAFTMMPFAWMLILSMKPPSEAFSREIRIWPETFYAIENYTDALVATPMLRFMANGVFVCALVLVLQILIAAPMAYALAKTRFPGRDILFGAVLIALLVPPEVLSIPLFIAFHYAGLIDTYAALIVPGVVSPFAIFLLRQFFKAVPNDLVHAARLDGLSELAIIWRVMLPAAMPAVIAFSILSVVGRWNDLFLPLTFLQSEHLMTPALGIVRFRNEEIGNAYGPLMAAATLVVAPLIVAFLFAQRRFVEGLTMSGLK